MHTFLILFLMHIYFCFWQFQSAIWCLCSCNGTSLPAMDGDGSDAGLLNPLDQTDGVLQLKPVNNMKPVRGEVSGNTRLCVYSQGV